MILKRIVGGICLAYMLQILSADLSSVDISSVGVSARAKGMGGMFTAVQKDPALTIHNPAGLAGLERFSFYSLSTKTLQEVQYLDYGIAGPVAGLGVLGLSYLDRRVSDIPLADTLIINNGTVDYSNVRKGSYVESLMVVSYANAVPLGQQSLALGVNAKFFRRALTNVAKASGSGFNLDFGAQYAFPLATVGLKLQNILQGTGKAAPGVFIWDTGESEQIESAMILGVATDKLQKNVLVGVDIRKSTTREYAPATFHAGLEWHPLDPLFLRCGMGQSLQAPDIADDGELTVLPYYTAGLGLNIYDWRFDYAYHPDNEIKELSSHWFSVSFVGPEPCVKDIGVTKAAVVVDKKKPIAITIAQPEDRSVTRSADIVVSGSVRNAQNYNGNGVMYFVSPNGVFHYALRLGVGINDIVVAVPNSGVTVNQKVLRVQSFKDIDNSPVRPAIEALATLGFIKGDYPDRFIPQRVVSRAEMADVVVRMQRLTSSRLQLKGIMDNVDVLSGYGIVTGFPDGLLRPDAKLTKGQVAMVMARMQQLSTIEQNRQVTYLQQTHWADGAIAALAATGLYTTEEFQPKNDYVTKEQLADYFSRLPIVSKKVAQLYNFEEVTFEEVVPTTSILFMRKAAVVSEQSDVSESELFDQLIAADQSASREVVASTVSAAVVEKLEPVVVVKASVSTKKNVVPQIKVIRPPRLVVYEPFDNQHMGAASVVVSGRAMSAVKVVINGATARLVNSVYTAKVSLKPGVNYIKIKAFNAAGKSTSVTLKVIR